MEQDKKQKNSKSHVHIFGEELNINEEKESKKEKRVSRQKICHGNCFGGIIQGLILVVGGLILVLNNVGLVSWEFWRYIWPFWPVLIILIGLRVIFGHNIVSDIIISIFALAFLAAVILFGLVKTGSPFINFLPPEVFYYIKSVGQFNLNNYGINIYD